MTSVVDSGDASGLRAALRETRAIGLAPPPRLSPSEWAEASVKLSRQTSSQAGRLRLYGYQRGILDAFAEEGAEVVAFMKSARVGYTQILGLGTGYYLEHAASPILSVFPSEQDARYFEKTYIRPLARDTECLAEILPDLDEQQWHSKATLRGSSLELKQAAKYDSFRAFNARLALGDEIDAPFWNAGKSEDSEGDKTALLRNRTESFPDGKMILGSTPTVTGRSRIESWYHRGDQRRYHVPCPHCGEEQVLEWGDRSSVHGVKWPEGRPGDAYYVCRHNGCVIDESEKPGMDARGRWVATATGERGVVSFHISALYSLMKKASWGRLAEEFVEATRLAKERNDKGRLQAFVNTKLGETWYDQEEEKGLRDATQFADLMQLYQAEVPLEVKFLTAGVDTQSGKRGSGGYWLVSVYGWGQFERPFLIGSWKLDEHPLDSPYSDQDLEALLRRPFRGADGRDHYIQAAAIDSGGDYPQKVYDFCRKHAARRWWAVKGWSKGGGKRSDRIWHNVVSNSVKVYQIDSDLAKDALFKKLHAPADTVDSFVLPATPITGSTPIDAEFLAGLASEVKEIVDGSGSWTWKDRSGRIGNHHWDCVVYAFAAVQGLKTLPPPNAFIRALDTPSETPPADDDGAAASTAPAPKRKKKRGFAAMRG